MAVQKNSSLSEKLQKELKERHRNNKDLGNKITEHRSKNDD